MAPHTLFMRAHRGPGWRTPSSWNTSSGHPSGLPGLATSTAAAPACSRGHGRVGGKARVTGARLWAPAGASGMQESLPASRPRMAGTLGKTESHEGSSSRTEAVHGADRVAWVCFKRTSASSHTCDPALDVCKPRSLRGQPTVGHGLSLRAGGQWSPLLEILTCICHVSRDDSILLL